MADSQGKFFWTHTYTIYWLIVGIILVLSMTLGNWARCPLDIPQGISIKGDAIPAVIMIISIVATSLFTFIFVLVNVLESQIFRGKRHQLRALLVLAVLSGAFSYFIASDYYSAASDARLCAPDALAKLSNESNSFTRFLRDYHLMIFIIFYLAIDFLVWVTSSEDSDKNLFGGIVIFIDIPILVTITFVTLAVQPVLGQRGFYIFEAGVISFQLFAGSLFAVGLEYFDKRIRSTT